MSVRKSKLNVVLGAAIFGDHGTSGARVSDVDEVNRMIDVFQAHGHQEIDCARVYGSGTAEKYIAKAYWEKRGLILETKLYPHVPGVGGEIVSHSPESLRKYLNISLKELNAKKVHIWYLHAPDRNIPFETTLRAVNDLHKEGLFDHFGISNYMSWEVAKIVEVCEANGFVKPSVYQGVYSAFQRSVEPELLPCLRHYKIAYYAYSPLAGGILTGHYKNEAPVQPGTRFDTSDVVGQAFRAYYWHDQVFEAIEIVRKAADAHKLRVAEVALRWIMHHSALKNEHGDAVIVGASSSTQLEQNLSDLDKGPLPEDVLKALDEGWQHVMPAAAGIRRARSKFLEVRLELRESDEGQTR